MDVRLPTLGEGADSGTVVNILVSAGDQITKGQTIIELETGKAVTPIPSSSAGQIDKILVKEGQKISVGAPILSVSGAAAEEAPAAAPAAKKTTPKAAPAREAQVTDEQGNGEEFE